MFGGGERVGEAVLRQTLDIAIGMIGDQPIESSRVDDRRTGGYDRVSQVTLLCLLLTRAECNICRVHVHWCFELVSRARVLVSRDATVCYVS